MDYTHTLDRHESDMTPDPSTPSNDDDKNPQLKTPIVNLEEILGNNSKKLTEKQILEDVMDIIDMNITDPQDENLEYLAQVMMLFYRDAVELFEREQYPQKIHFKGDYSQILCNVFEYLADVQKMPFMSVPIKMIPDGNNTVYEAIVNPENRRKVENTISATYTIEMPKFKMELSSNRPIRIVKD